jgi:hypothetical protein
MKAAIRELLAETYMDAPEIQSRIAAHARGDYSEYILADGTVDLEAMKADNTLHLVKAIRPTAQGLVVEFYDSLTALTTLAKITGLLRDRMEVSGPDGGPVRTETTVKPDLSKLTDEELERLENLLTKATDNDASRASDAG